MTAMDRPEQGLDMIQEAMLHLGMTPGEDFHLALNCAAQEIFDFVSVSLWCLLWKVNEHFYDCP